MSSRYAMDSLFQLQSSQFLLLNSPGLTTPWGGRPGRCRQIELGLCSLRDLLVGDRDGTKMTPSSLSEPSHCV
jgi:hypothetical protein